MAKYRLNYTTMMPSLNETMGGNYAVGRPWKKCGKMRKNAEICGKICGKMRFVHMAKFKRTAIMIDYDGL